jgi:hypothetical protein
MSGSSYTSGQVLTAQELNASFNSKVDANNAQITGGQITGVTNIDITGTTDSTSPSTGALVVAGGAGIGESLQVGGNTTVGGSVYANGTTQSVSINTGALVVAGGLGVAANANIGGSVVVGGSVSAQQASVQSTTDSTNANNGALVVAGGAGVAKTLNVGGAANVGGALSVTGATTVSGLLEAANFTLLAGGAITYADGSTQSTAGAIDGEFPISTTGGTTTITAAEAASNNIFKVTGILASNATLVFPAKAKSFTVQNGTTGTFSLTVKASGQTPSVSVVQGTSGTLFTDTTGCYATSAASGIGFSGEFPDSTGLTLSLTHIGAFVQQTAPGITTTLPLASTYPAGKGVVIGNKSTGTNNLAHQGSDTMELPTTIMAGDVYFAASDGVSNWAIGWYAATKTVRATAIQFADGTTQTTANGTTMPTSTLYSVSAGNVTLGATSITTSGYTSPFVAVYKNNLRLVNGVDWTFAGDNKTINLTVAIGKNDQFEVLTNVVITPSTSYTPSSNYFKPASGASSIGIVYTVGFVRLYQNGSRLIIGQDYTATDGANINFVGFTANGTDDYEVELLTPMTFANSVAQSNPVLGGALVFADGSSQGTATPGRNRIINGACRVSQRGSLAAASGVTGYGGPDRYVAQNGGSAGGQFTQSQGTITYNGVSYSAVVQTVNTAIASTSGGNFWGGICQAIEGYNCCDLVGQKVAITFLFNTNVSGTFAVSLNDYTGTQSYTTTFSATANTPKIVTIVVPALPTNLNVPNSNAGGLQLRIGGLNNGTYMAGTLNSWIAGNYLFAAATATNWGAATNNFIAVTNLKLEAGGAPTPMEPLSYAQELVLCQRYYQQNSTNTTDLTGNCIFSGSVTSGVTYYGTVKFPVRMRAAPSITLSQNAQSNFNLATANYTAGPAQDGFVLSNSANSTGGGGAFFYGWSANAEL